MKEGISKLLKRVIEVVKTPRFKKTLVLVIIFLAGLVSGALLANQSDNDTKSSTVNPAATSNLSAADLQKRSVERLEKNYTRSKERITKDLASKRITQAQADKITEKLDEIYKYKKENIDKTTDEVRSELQKKRSEWRKWIEENDLSSRYFIGVM